MTDIATDRRGFLFGLGATLFADPKLLASRLPIIYGDGVHDDYEGLQALVLGKPVRLPTGDTFAPGDMPSLSGGVYRLSRVLNIPEAGYLSFTDAVLNLTDSGGFLSDSGAAFSLKRCFIRTDDHHDADAASLAALASKRTFATRPGMRSSPDWKVGFSYRRTN